MKRLIFALMIMLSPSIVLAETDARPVAPSVTDSSFIARIHPQVMYVTPDTAPPADPADPANADTVASTDPDSSIRDLLISAGN